MILPQALEAWQTYLGMSDEDPVLHAAVAHAQFEILHPFKDGNGRIGRMLIPLLLFQRHALSRPMFYLSEYLEANRELYYDGLLEITDRGNWQGWIEFFAGAIVAQAEEDQRKVKEMLALYDSLKQRIIEITHSQFAVPALDAFFVSPIVNSTSFAQQAGIRNRVTANGILKQMLNSNLIRLTRKGSGRSPAVYALPELLNIVEGRKVF
jgi:Fic family protein